MSNPDTSTLRPDTALAAQEICREALGEKYAKGDETSIAEVRSRSVTFDYLVTNADTGERLATVTTSLISLGANGRPVAMPAELRRQMSGE